MTGRADVAIIGAGPGGYVAALRAAQLGANVVCIERGALGGVCLNEGCIPTKALLRTAEVYDLVRRAGEFGVSASEPSVDWPKAQERKGRVVQQMVRGVGTLLSRAGVTVIQGEAQFVRGDTLSVRLEDGTDTVQADHIVIATGSRTAQVPIPGLDGPNVIDHWGALELEALPESICIIGAGAIGLEFASLFSTFGVTVTLIEMLPRVAPLMDASIGGALEWSLSQRGVEILTSARVTELAHGASGCVVNVATEDGERQIEAEKVLSAIGRTPNVDGLGLDILGIQPTRAGIRVDDRMRTVAPNIYAIGDVAAEGPMLAHVASRQGVVAVEDALGQVSRMDYTAVPSCIFSIPEAASVGLTEEQAREAGHDVQVGTFPLQANGKAVALGDTDGFVKVVAESGNKALLGVHVVGPHASDLILEGTLGISMEGTLDEIEGAIHPHPALGEAVAEAALVAMGRPLAIPHKR